MTNAKKIIHTPDPPKTMAAFEQRLAEVMELNAALAARVKELESPPDEPLLALKLAAGLCGVDPETTRIWCIKGFVEAQQDGKRWFVRLSSLKARAARFGYKPQD